MKRTEVALGWKSIPGYRHQIEGRDNEDAVIVSTDHALFDALMIVADGMGGHDEPKQAAETAAAAARDYLTRPELVERYAEAGHPVEFLRQALRYANGRVVALGSRSGWNTPLDAKAASSGGPYPSGKNPGSTLTVAAIADGELHVAHAGDGSTMLMRDGRLRPLVGGEDRRLGNRPEEYLGRGPQIQTEEASEPLAAGDRILICTDGLTRYFGPVMVGGGGGLGEVLGRASADPQAIANQLTAHSRTDQYDDDTTVVVAEVVEMRSARRSVLGARRSAGDGPFGPSTEHRAPSAERRAPPLWRAAWPVALLSVGMLAAAWLVLAVWRPFAGPPSRPSVSVTEEPATPAALRSLPKEDLILIDKAAGRFYVLRSRPTGSPPEPVELQAMRPGKDGLLEFAGRYRWDPEKRTLRDLRAGRKLIADFDSQQGTLRAPGILEITTEPAGAACWINGKAAGKTPIKRLSPAGPTRVRVRWESGAEQTRQVTVPSGRRVPISFEGAP